MSINMKKIEAKDFKQLKVGDIIVYDGITEIVTHNLGDISFYSAPIVKTTVEIWDDDNEDENHFCRASHHAGCFNDYDIILVFENEKEYIEHFTKELKGLRDLYINNHKKETK